MKVFAFLIGALLAALLTLVHYELRKDEAFEASCHEKNGMVIHTEERLYCIRRDAIIPNP